MIRCMVVLTVTGLLVLAMGGLPGAIAQDEPSTDPSSTLKVESTGDAAESPVDAQQGSGAPTERGPGQAPQQAIDPADLPPEFVKAMNAADARFKGLREQLADKLFEMRTTHTKYVNYEARTKQDADKYHQERNEAKQLLNQTFDAALDVIRYHADNDAATFLVTMIEHRFDRDIYDASTMEAGARLIDGGVRMAYVFLATGRAAVSHGDFKLARKIYESLDPNDLDDVDKRLIFSADAMESQWKKEKELLEKDAKEDRLPRVKLETTRGDVLVELYIDQAPSTVANFIKLVEEGFYDGLDFYQVIDHLLALTGDDSGDGSGSTGQYLKDEHTREDARAPLRGCLVMAKLPLGDGGKFIPNSASSQFAILYLPTPSVSKEQTVFGRVVEGMDVVGAFRRVDPNKKKEKGEILLPPDRIIRATVVRRPDELPEINYVDPRAAGAAFTAKSQ